jgi:hypothetical protein
MTMYPNGARITVPSRPRNKVKTPSTERRANRLLVIHQELDRTSIKVAVVVVTRTISRMMMDGQSLPTEVVGDEVMVMLSRQRRLVRRPMEILTGNTSSKLLEGDVNEGGVGVGTESVSEVGQSGGAERWGRAEDLAGRGM